MKKYSKVLVPLFAVSEILAIAMAAYIAVFLRYGIEPNIRFVNGNILLISVVMWPVLASASGYYRDRRTRTFFGSISHLTIQWTVTSFFLLAYLVLTKSDISRLTFSLFLILGHVFLTVISIIRHQFLVKIRTRGMNQRIIAYIGFDEEYSTFTRWLQENPSFGYSVKYFVDIQLADNMQTSLNELEYLLSEHRFDEILVGQFKERTNVLTDVVDIAEEYGCRVRIVQESEDFYSKQLAFHQFGPFQVFSVREEPLAYVPAKFFKRMFDIVFSSLVLLFIYWWIHLLVWVLIELSSKGPVFFKQKRVGKNGAVFYCYKFRTMESNGSTCEGQGEITKKADPRITPIGAFLRKTNLDELPQFINVLRGEMSVIGPRPHMLEEDYEVAKKLRKYRIRRFIRPGISGWAQVNGFRGGTEDMTLMQKRVDYDIDYIESWTPWLDLKIIWYTILQMLTLRTGAY